MTQEGKMGHSERTDQNEPLETSQPRAGSGENHVAKRGVDTGTTTSGVFSLRHCPALPLLLEAYDLAREVGAGVWDFAVEIKELRRVGVTNSRLRWLACHGIIEHSFEKKPSEGGTRVFQQAGRLTFSDKTCFTLTKAGADLARKLLGREWDTPEDGSVAVESDPAGTTEPVVPSAEANGLVPKWDYERQELRLGARVVKQFKVPAPNQEQILAAFEEEGWPVRIYDPLPPNRDNPEQDPKRRLHDTIGSLNRHQKNRLIRFVGDGSGEGIRWELASTSNGESPANDA
jgi:hypothetical protein